MIFRWYAIVLNQIVRLKIGKNDKFSRPLVDIYIPGANEESEENEEICVNDWLVTNNFARLYHGEKKKSGLFNSCFPFIKISTQEKLQQHNVNDQQSC